MKLMEKEQCEGKRLVVLAVLWTAPPSSCPQLPCKPISEHPCLPACHVTAGEATAVTPPAGYPGRSPSLGPGLGTSLRVL